MYQVSPFVDHFVDLKASSSAKEELFKILAVYYEEKIKKAIEKFFKEGNPEDIKIVIKKYDSNIQHIFSYLLKGEQRMFDNGD